MEGAVLPYSSSANTVGDFDADPGPRKPCVVAAMDKFTGTTEILWRKRDSKATLSRGERPDSCLDRLSLHFWAHYIEDDPHLVCTDSL